MPGSHGQDLYSDPSTSGPRHYTEATPSGPQQQPQYTDPSVSGPHQQPQYTEATPSGPQQQPQYVDPNLPPLAPGQPYGDYPPQQPYGDPGHAQQQYGQQQQQQGGRHALAGGADLSSAHLVKRVKRRPQSGWRRGVYVATGHLLNPGESPADRKRRELISRVNQPLRGCYKIAMLSLKGGVGKTTTTTTLGSTFASLRGDRVVAVDANPDRGTLSQKLPIETTATVRHLLRDADKITRYSDVRSYTSQGASRLEVLASEQDPAVSEAFSETDYRRTVNLLEHFYNIVLTDCGTGLMHSAMKGVLDVADSLVLVSSGSVDGARSASATLDWLDAHGYGELVKRSVAVINSVRPKGGSVDLDKLAAHFGARTRGVCQIPFDPHLEEGAEIELDRLNADTRLALLELAATVADGFPHDRSIR
ncbi:hypothetical protein CFN78_00610 [Amycolatopsis antarctica]|uniref:CobQ/CobB/MinD/ParA nucleotide binding domain-containing protein n=1 Tax=Amycolatopsis antarctica TaxID=1854586 RepID=A0A263D9T3_9PSEU|nr:hypothetical protein CFN78_00610 [Amycolatopsis antarctica]